MRTKWPSYSFGDKRLLVLMKASPSESPDECGTERRSNEDGLGRQIGLHPSFYFPSFDSTVRQIEDCKPKTEGVMDNCWSFSQNILIIYSLSHRQAQKLAYRQLVSYCCYFGWCNRVILPSGAMLKVKWAKPDEENRHTFFIHALSVWECIKLSADARLKPCVQREIWLWFV